MAGNRSLLAYWIGGAASPAIVGTQGKRSMLAFWMGGAASVASGAPPAVIADYIIIIARRFLRR